MGTPLYLYSHATILQHYGAFDGAFAESPHLTCFSVKSNSNAAILRLFAGQGGGADIVSGGELYRATSSGGAARQDRLFRGGQAGRGSPVRPRLPHPHVQCRIHAGVAGSRPGGGRGGRESPRGAAGKPGRGPEDAPVHLHRAQGEQVRVDIADAVEYYRTAAGLGHVEVKGVSCHIGSQLTQVAPVVDALRKLKDLVTRLTEAGIPIEYLDLGGGLGITYDSEEPPHPRDYARAVKDELGSMDLTLIFEPGRVIMGNAGILVTRVVYTKSTARKTFFIVDAGMNDLMRPSLYGRSTGCGRSWSPIGIR